MEELYINNLNGLYVIAVSGGVDSMALLHRLANTPNVKLIVAHYDHGIREDSHVDRDLVRQVAKQYKLPFVYDKGELGSGVSEAKAREARYKFLNNVLSQSGAKSIITAHHQDDVLETAILNLIRGTGRKGLSSIMANRLVSRPLVDIPKSKLYDYAKKNRLYWREDSTNKDMNLKRNYVRHIVIPKLSEDTKKELLAYIKDISIVNNQLDEEIDDYLNRNIKDSKLSKHSIIMLPHKVSKEVMAQWLRNNGVREFSKRNIEDLVVAVKALKPGARASVNLAYFLDINKDDLALSHRDR